MILFNLSYPYVFIKMTFLKSLIMDKNNLNNLKKINDIKTLIKFIKRYYPDLEVKNLSIVEIEIAITNYYIKLIGKIMYYSPDNMILFLRNYLLIYEILNVKRIIFRSIAGVRDGSKKTHINFLVENYLGNTGFIEGLLEKSSLEEIQLYINEKRSLYNSAIREGFQHFIRKKEIFVLETFLDQVYYQVMINNKNFYMNNEKKPLISLFIDYKAEIYNLNIIFRGILNGIDRKLLSQFLVNNYLFFNYDKFMDLLYQENIDDFLISINKYLRRIRHFGAFFTPITINKNNLMNLIEKVYDNYFLKKSSIIIEDIDNMAINRILNFLIKKEKEIKDEILPNIVRIVYNNYSILQQQII
jgi:vacuolar-type H+-ATPase subunit C/Vma6